MDICSVYSKYLECTSVCTDTRKIENDSIFFALKGPNFNANSMAAQALEAGAKYAVIDEAAYKTDDRYIVTQDVLTTLQELAKYHRKQLNIPIIAITGSNGKTTTKELTNAVLGTSYFTYATQGNLNNHIGVPLTLLAMKKGVEIGIVEMGANHQQEIAFYCSIAAPTHGIITNIGKAHLEGFGGVEGVKKGKGELYDYLGAHGGRAFVNSGSQVLTEMAAGLSEAVFYPQHKDYYHCSLLEEGGPLLTFKAEDGEICETRLIGKYNFENIAAALCIGKFFKVRPALANMAVAAYDPTNNRSQVFKKKSNTLVLDAYNANPSSMKAAIENFKAMPAENKILVLGDMFELGGESQYEHEALGKLLNELKPGKTLLCGMEMSAAARNHPEALYFQNREGLEQWIKAHPFQGATVLIKGSRGMGLEKVAAIID